MFGHYVQTGLNGKGHSLRLDIMSTWNQIKETWTAFGQNVQTEACK